ncbi:MAG: hypothetical protein JSS79_10345 [Bacteroidetes bacterium]|nr:hypothetical protein [Bacteroidota bacterium]
MENSEQLEKIIDLGKMLVKELGLDPGVDTLARWMAHYLAEKIQSVEKLPEGAEKAEAEKECCELILKIWEHRNHMPRGKRPFESFEPILNVLKSLDPDNSAPFLHRISEHELKELENTNSNYKDIKLYIESVVEIEKVARVWMESLLNQAALKVSDEKTKAWLQTASRVSLSDDIHSIKIVVKNFNLLEDDDDSSSQNSSRLEKRIQQLEKFGKLNEFLLKTYRDELERTREAKSE